MTTVNPLHEVERLRIEIGRVQQEIEWVEKSPLPRADWKTRVAVWVDRQAETASSHMASLRGLRRPEKPGSDISDCMRIAARVMIPGGSQPDVRPVELSLASFMAWLYGEDLIARLHAMIDADEYVSGPPLAERPARLQALRGELRDLEASEESVITAAEAEHVFIARRADADPVVVLGYDQHGEMSTDGIRRVGFDVSIASGAA